MKLCLERTNVRYTLDKKRIQSIFDRVHQMIRKVFLLNTSSDFNVIPKSYSMVQPKITSTFFFNFRENDQSAKQIKKDEIDSFVFLEKSYSGIRLKWTYLVPLEVSHVRFTHCPLYTLPALHIARFIQ